jgi:flagellar P-ring protein precursor FlgI
MLSALARFCRTRRSKESVLRATPLMWGSMLAALFLGFAAENPVHASSRIKDIIDFEGVRDNMLVGYGLVVGLTGSGDDLTNSAFTKQSLVAMLERLGVNTRDVSLKTKNIAAVMVTATLPSFARQGTRIDITVAAPFDNDAHALTTRIGSIKPQTST